VPTRRKLQEDHSSMDSKENKSIEEELETLISIYGNEFQKLDPTQDRFKYQIAIPLKGNSQTLFLRFTLPAEYPNIAGPHFEIASKWLTPTQLTRLSDHLKELYTQLEPKQHIIYRWTEWSVSPFVLYTIDSVAKFYFNIRGYYL